MPPIEVADLAGVVYSAGKVFDGLRAGRVATENFLQSGNLDGVTSRADLALLQDLRDVAQFVIDNADDQIDAAYVRAINAQLTRTAALHPGQLRTDEQPVVVRTRYGRHEPTALTNETLQEIVAHVIAGDDPLENALDVFVALAKAQPFEDGNKRTALFVADGLLIGAGSQLMLTVPVDDQDPAVAGSFNDLLARAYVHNEPSGVKNLLRERGFANLDCSHDAENNRRSTRRA